MLSWCNFPTLERAVHLAAGWTLSAVILMTDKKGMPKPFRSRTTPQTGFCPKPSRTYGIRHVQVQEKLLGETAPPNCASCKHSNENGYFGYNVLTAAPLKGTPRSFLVQSERLSHYSRVNSFWSACGTDISLSPPFVLPPSLGGGQGPFLIRLPRPHELRNRLLPPSFVLCCWVCFGWFVLCLGAALSLVGLQPVE